MASVTDGVCSVGVLWMILLELCDKQPASSLSLFKTFVLQFYFLSAALLTQSLCYASTTHVLKSDSVTFHT